MKRRIALTMYAAVTILAACSVAGGPGSAAPSGQPLAAKLNPAGSRMMLTPPGQASAAVKSADAFGLCANGVADCDPSIPTEIDLALATDPDFGPANAGGSVTPRLNDTLVWAIMWRGITCPSGGGAKTLATPTPTPSTNSAAPLCDKFALVDATKGEFIYSYLYPHQ